ncbi:hypothetical protein CDD83_6004 [Cordyceps sp. RAO-2017]|nr:hypothetical protein CDD83_6004 [Cordyceps sp. RAO-2017]
MRFEYGSIAPAFLIALVSGHQSWAKVSPHDAAAVVDGQHIIAQHIIERPVAPIPGPSPFRLWHDRPAHPSPTGSTAQAASPSREPVTLAKISLGPAR